MRIHPFSSRFTLALTLAGTLLGVAPGAASQRLEVRVGDPIPYRVSLPASARITSGAESLSAETNNLFVIAAATDLSESRSPRLPVSDGEARRLMTSMFMDSDELLLALLRESYEERLGVLSEEVLEFRTLGGQRAGYLRSDFNQGRERGSVEMHATVKDGVLYVLTIVMRSRGNASLQRLATQIQESFVLPDAPPVGGTRTRLESAILGAGESR